MYYLSGNKKIKVRNKLERGYYDRPKSRIWFVNCNTGSWRQITPEFPGEVESEFEHEKGLEIKASMDGGGEIVVDVLRKDEEEWMKRDKERS